MLLAHTMTTYAELRIRIDRGVGRGSYRVVATGPSGEVLGRFKLPFSELELENFILKVGATRRGRRRIESPEMELAKSFGTKLFGAVFEGDVRELYRSSMAETRAEGAGLRLSLSLTGAPELLQVPWEYLYDHPSFLSISTWTPIVRYLDLPKPRRPLQVALPLRILAMVSAPNDAERIDVPQERAKLEQALGSLIAIGAITIDWLEEASLRALQRQLRKGEYHVFHFIGHGGYDQNADDGILLFEDEIGRGRRISGIQLGTILADEVSLRLAVLNSCEGARTSLQDPFSGVATSLIEREIPAVIGMQFEITDRAAIVFAGEFYSALADGLTVDSSVAEARKAIYADENDIEWGTPVLFMRVADGRLFDVGAHEPIRPVATETTGASPAAVTADASIALAASSDLANQKVAEDAPLPEVTASAKPDAEEVAERTAAEAARDELALDSAKAAERAAAETAKAAERAAAEASARADAERAERAIADASVAEPWVSEDELLAPGVAVAAGETVGRSLSGVRDEPPSRASTAAEHPAGTTSAPLAIGTGLPIDLTRVAGRAAIGGFLAASFAETLYVTLDSRHLDAAGGFPGYAAAMVTAMVASLVLAEGIWPPVRLPDGQLYRSVGGHRRAAVALQGAIIGVTVGAVVTLLVGTSESPLTIAIFMAGFTAAGFVVAEVVIDRLVKRRTGKSNRG